jgi:glycerol-1-phosphate dehydrogenase [NAD(P)+]
LGPERFHLLSSADRNFTDLPTICKSPRFLTASGFGDSIGKFTSSTDWKFTHLIWESALDEDIYQHALHAARQTTAEIEGIQRAEPESMARLMDSQFESGFCMADFVNSAPASGGEHHIAHIWEMIYHWQGREGLFHGNAVGVATLIEAGWFERLRALSKADAEKLLKKAVVPSKEDQIKAIKEQVPLIADDLIRSNPIYLQLADQAVLERCRRRILEHWDEIQTIAANVPLPGNARLAGVIGRACHCGRVGYHCQQVRIAKDFGCICANVFP